MVSQERSGKERKVQEKVPTRKLVKMLKERMEEKADPTSRTMSTFMTKNTHLRVFRLQIIKQRTSEREHYHHDRAMLSNIHASRRMNIEKEAMDSSNQRH